MDVTQFVMTLYSKTGVQAVETLEWEGTLSLMFASRGDAQRAFDAIAQEGMTVSPPVLVDGQYSITVVPEQALG